MCSCYLYHYIYQFELEIYGGVGGEVTSFQRKKDVSSCHSELHQLLLVIVSYINYYLS